VAVALGRYRLGVRRTRLDIRESYVEIPSFDTMKIVLLLCSAPSRVADYIKLNDEMSFERAMKFGAYCVCALASAPLLSSAVGGGGSRFAPYWGIAGSIAMFLLMFPCLTVMIGRSVDGERITFINYIHIAAYTLIFHVFDAAMSVAFFSTTSERVDAVQSAISAMFMIWAAVVLAKLLKAKTDASYFRIGGGIFPILALTLYAIATPPAP